MIKVSICIQPFGLETGGNWPVFAPQVQRMDLGRNIDRYCCKWDTRLTNRLFNGGPVFLAREADGNLIVRYFDAAARRGSRHGSH